LLGTFPQRTLPPLSSRDMAQTATGAKAPKETQDVSPAQAPTYTRPRTARRHHVTQLPTRLPAQHLHASASWQGGLDQRTPSDRCARHRLLVPMPLPRLPPRTHAAPAHPVRRNGPNTHVPACTQEVPGNKPFCIWQPCVRDSGN
jgi:hypothetical protein